MDIKDDNYFLTVEYNFLSNIGDEDPDRYHNQYSVKVMAHSHDMPDEEALIGKAQITLILLGLATNHQFDRFHVFDARQATLELGEAIYDFEKYDYKDELQEYYNYELFSENICFLERLELLSEYRGNGLGKRIIKEFTERFFGCCGLIALKACPLQLVENNGSNDGWYNKMRFDEFVQDEKQARYQLYAYYRSLGFDQPFDNEYFFINPAWKNEALETIEDL